MRGEKPKKRETDKQIYGVGQFSDISGNVNISGRNITTHHTTAGMSAIEIHELFE